MDILSNLALGFHAAPTPINVGYCIFGAFIGTLIGVLPGLGSVTTIAMLLPITFQIPATSSLIMLAGIYYGAHHAGSTAAIMLNMPGEPTIVVICFDGYPMAQQGRAGVALFIAAIGSFFADSVGVMVIATLSPILARTALLFGPVEYTSMIVTALVMASVLTAHSPITPISIAILPEVPTISEVGERGYEANEWTGYVVRSRTPPAIVETLNRSILRALEAPDVVAAFTKASVYPRHTTPRQAEAFILNEIAKWHEVIVKAGITLKSSG